LFQDTVGLNTYYKVMLMCRRQVSRTFVEQRRTIGSQLQRILGNSLWWFIWQYWCQCCLQ